jgi:predicted ATP-dependent endonuclease of OLD family
MRDLINATLNDLNHKYIDANFKDSFVVDQKKYADMSVENSGVEIELDEIIKFEGKNSNFSSSSGVQIFTLLNILSKFIQIDNDKIKNEIINGYHLIIDEPEKFLHNELLMKVAETICALSKIIEVSIATHSLQLLTHFILLSKKENYDVNLRVCYIDETQTDNKHKITEPIDIGILKNQNQNNVIARIMNCFFSTNIILVEGPYDESVFYDLLLDELFKNKL